MGFQVSIPNGKPGPLRQAYRFCHCDRFVKFQSQTGSQALSDVAAFGWTRAARPVSIPNGKPGPLRPGEYSPVAIKLLRFKPKREAKPSQTHEHEHRHDTDNAVSIPNGKPGPLRPDN